MTSCLLKDRAHDWWEEVGRAIRDDTVLDAITWIDFPARFGVEFAPVIKV